MKILQAISVGSQEQSSVFNSMMDFIQNLQISGIKEKSTQNGEISSQTMQNSFGNTTMAYLSKKDAILISRKYNLEKEIRQELDAGLSPEDALREWDIL